MKKLIESEKQLRQFVAGTDGKYHLLAIYHGEKLLAVPIGQRLTRSQRELSLGAFGAEDLPYLASLAKERKLFREPSLGFQTQNLRAFARSERERKMIAVIGFERLKCRDVMRRMPDVKPNTVYGYLRACVLSGVLGRDEDGRYFVPEGKDRAEIGLSTTERIRQEAKRIDDAVLNWLERESEPRTKLEIGVAVTERTVGAPVGPTRIRCSLIRLVRKDLVTCRVGPRGRLFSASDRPPDA